MASEGELIVSSKIPGLFGLPREIRDLIYNELLVQTTEIQLNCGVASDLGLEKRAKDHIETWFPLQRPADDRATWLIPISDVSHELEFSLPTLDEEATCEEKPSIGVHMTYQLADPIEITELNLRLLLTCRQMYEEGRKVFYSRNTFHFSDSFRIPTALHFLQDRPMESRAHIHSLELELTEQNQSNIRSTPNELIAFVSQPQTRSRLTYSYDFFEPLCKLLSSKMQLRYLGLRLESFHDSWLSGQPLNTVASCLHAEQTENGHPPPVSLGQPLWLQPLLQIRSLRRINFVCHSEFSQIRRVANIVRQMRENMLADVKLPTTTMPKVTTKSIEDLTLQLHYGSYELDLGTEYPDGTDFSIKFDISNDSVEWDSCILNESGFQLRKVGEGGVSLWKGADLDGSTIHQVIGSEITGD